MTSGDLTLQREPPPSQPPESDFDLDSLLSDLTSFNPSDVVASRKPVPPAPPPRRDTVNASPSHRSPSHSSHSSHSTPVHNHATPTPPRYIIYHTLHHTHSCHHIPSTPGHTPNRGPPPPTRARPPMVRAQTEDAVERPHPQGLPRSHSITSPSHERAIEQGQIPLTTSDLYM